MQVHAHEPVPIVVAGIFYGLEQVHAGIVKQQSHRTEFCFHLVSGRGHPITGRNVDFHPHNLIIVERRQCPVDRILTDIRHCYLATFSQ